MSLPVRSGFCSEPGERELLADDAPVQDEPAVVVPGAAQVFEGSQRVEARPQRIGQALAGGIEPQGTGPGQDADSVALPHGVPVGDALGVVPHPVPVDQPGTGPRGDVQAAAVHVGGHTGDHGLRGGSQPCRPGGAHLVQVPSDAAGGDDDRRGKVFERLRPWCGCWPPRARAASCSKHRAAHPGDGAVSVDQLVELVAPEHRQLALGLGRPGRPDEGFQQPGTRAPGDVEAGHGVARALGARRRRVRPSRPPGRSGRRARAAIRACRRRPIGRRPGPILRAQSSSSRSKPAVLAQSRRASSSESLTPSRRCSGESTRKIPPKLQWACPPRFASDSWSSSSTRAPAAVASVAATSPARPAPTTMTSKCCECGVFDMDPH